MFDIIVTQFNNKFSYSPLDQFGGDSIMHDLLDFFICRFLDSVDFIKLNELLDLSLLQSILFNFISLNFYDDDDCADSEWEDNNAYVLVMQSIILSANGVGTVPGAETLTSEASLTFFYSFTTMSTLILAGLILHGIRYLSILFPDGTPLIMTPFIIVIELVSYMARAISLGMRLFANMFAGHSLVKILMSFSWLFTISILPILGLLIIILVITIFFMEGGIAYLQSYVFGALSAMYFEDIIVIAH
jgi:ATP synthase subunit 6